METQEQIKKKLDIDLWIIALVTFAVFMVYGMNSRSVMAFCKNSEVSVWPRLLLAAAFEFGMAGLGITIVCLLRKEPFQSFGLRKENTLKTILGTIVCFIPYFAYLYLTGQFKGYEPFSIMVTPDLHKAGILATITGTLIIAVVWGFFEGFNYAVICEKINRRYPTDSRFFDWGSLICAIMCILFHPMKFTILGVIEMITTFVAIYGMLQVRKAYDNSWGCIFAFMFIWNAI